MNLNEVKEERGELLNKIDDLLTLVDSEKRDMSEGENKEYKSLEEQIDQLDSKIEMLEKQEERRKAIAAKKIEDEKLAAAAAGGSSDNGETREQDKIKEKYSFFDAYTQLKRGKFEGLVGEMHEQAQKEARNADYELSGAGLPAFMVEMRADVDQANSAIQGTDVGAYVGALRQNSVFSQVIPSSNILNGLSSDVNIQDVNKQSTAWATAENSQAADGGANLDKVTLSPIRLTSRINVSNRIGAQNGPIVMNALMADLGRDAANKIDAALFSTADVSNAIPAIAATSGVLTFTEAGTYAAPSATVNGSIYDDVLAALQALANADALQGSTAIVHNSKVLSDLIKSPQVLSVSGAVSSANLGSPSVFNINGIPVYLTTSTTSSGTTSADMIGGDFSRTYLGFFGGVDMMVNPYIRAEYAQDQIVFHRWLDSATVQGEAFVKATSLLS